jgi:hypothetical protein
MYVILIFGNLSAFISIFLFGVPFRFAYLSFLQLGLLEFGAILHTFIPGISRDSLLLFGKKNYSNIDTFAGFTEYILFTLQICLHSRFQLKYRLNIWNFDGQKIEAISLSWNNLMFVLSIPYLVKTYRTVWLDSNTVCSSLLNIMR